MSQGRRVEKVAARIRRELGQLLINGVPDQRVNACMVSITEVEVAGDLQHCKVFVSVYGSDIDKDLALDGLDASISFFRGELASKLQLRRTPEIKFYLDRALEKGNSVLQILDRLDKKRESESNNQTGLSEDN